MIEIIGLPGAGKTFLANAMARELNIPNITISNRIEKFLLSALFLLVHPVDSWRLIYRVSRETGNCGLKAHKISVLMFTAMAKEQKARLLGSGIIDEGLLQFIYFSIPENIVDKIYINKLPVPKKILGRKVILLETPMAIRRQRMVDRGRFPRKKFGTGYRERWEQLIEENFRHIKPILSKKFTVVRVTGE